MNPTDNLNRSPNRLAQEGSPYLLQHAYNPVDWYPWGEEAFEKARREDKPIFLSIGYSTCHWCHVMERESFEDEGVAQLMNRAFVSIKVDREERPDIDNIYMTVCQMMTGSGGWPLTILMTPDKQPFFAATYIPRTARFGSAGMMDLIPRIEKLWRQDREKLLQVGAQVAQVLAQEEPAAPGRRITAETSRAAFEEFRGRYDHVHGGFGRAPKFPTPHNLTFLLRYGHRTGEAHALQMVRGTLEAMRAGGVYDHVGGGFHRYSTDREWLVPHFEKMLYDQALLTIACTEAWQATGESGFRQTIEETIEYVLRDMTSPEGAFYSAEDADSEGEEGKFYVWTRSELLEAIGADDGKLFATVYGATGGGNFSEEATGHRTGANILHLPQPIEETAADLKLDAHDLRSRLVGLRARLLDLRGKRVRPLRDDKVLTDWNGLMIAALSVAARTLGEAQYAAIAARAAGFVLDNLRTPQGRLLHRFREGQAGSEGNLDDYAFLVWGLIELYEASFDARWLRAAVELNAVMLERFTDASTGSLYFTADDAETVLARRKETYDGAVPSGNSVAALNLLRLARLTGAAELEARAEQLLSALAAPATAMPAAHTQLLVASEFILAGPMDIVVVGSPGAEDTREMLRAIHEGPQLARSVILKDPQNHAELVALAPHVAGNEMVDGKATAYLCRGGRCLPPTTDAGEVARALREG